MTDLRTDNIYYAIEALVHEAERLSWNAKGPDQRDRARDLKLTATLAQQEYRVLSAKLPRLRSLIAEADRAYDRYVSCLPGEDGCSCHISPPCGYCTRDSDGSGEAGETGTGSTEGDSAGRQASPEPSIAQPHPGDTE